MEGKLGSAEYRKLDFFVCQLWKDFVFRVGRMPKKKKPPQVRKRNGWGAGAKSENVPEWGAAEWTSEAAAAIVPEQRSRQERRVLGKPKWSSKGSEACTFCVLWCEPPLGFHREMMQEVQEVFDVPSKRRNMYVSARLGSVVDVYKIRVLRTAERAFVQAWCPSECFSMDHNDHPKSQLREIKQMAEWIDWGVALQAWAKYSGRFPGSPFEYEEEWKANPPSFSVCCKIFAAPNGVSPMFGEVEAQVGICDDNELGKNSASCTANDVDENGHALCCVVECRGRSELPSAQNVSI